jgi:hypothetical protein
MIPIPLDVRDHWSRRDRPRTGSQQSRTFRAALVWFAAFQEMTMRSFLRNSVLAASCLVMGWAFAGCSSGEDDSGKVGGALGKMDGGAMDKGKMGGGAMDKDKMGGGAMEKDKMDGAMEKSKLDGAMEKSKMDK